MRPGSPTRRRAGFTLVELGVVVLIIGIMMSFLLVASWEGLKRANERATQSLIQKLDIAVSDRLEALAGQRPEPNNAHRFMALSLVPDAGGNPIFVESEARARLIAQVDYLKRELPDVFFVQADPNDLGNGVVPPYPLNFAGVPFDPQSMPVSGPVVPSPSAVLPDSPNAMANAAQYMQYILPLGHAMRINWTYNPDTSQFVGPVNPPDGIRLGQVAGLGTIPSRRHYRSPAAGEGIFGASYSAMGSLTRLLGYPARGYNGIDDDGNGLIDEFTIDELFRPNDPNRVALFNELQQDVSERLLKHRHVTARSEMLYAILVGGVGPLGSVFSPDDFTDTEVRDTDGDGLPEFVDSWGRPLQFYRWPTHFVSDYGAPNRGLQKGEAPYTVGNLSETREENTLDPNKLLITPGWWANPLSGYPDSTAQMSSRANTFQRHFFSLTDPYGDQPEGSRDLGFNQLGFLWDRTHVYKRRSYFFKHLIASAGPDGELGVGSFGVEYNPSGQNPVPGPFRPPGAPADTFAAQMVLIENQASRSDPFARLNNPGNAGIYQEPGISPFTDVLRDRWGVDDITNHSINTLGSGGR